MPHGWQLLDRPAEFDAVRSALTSAGSFGAVLVGDAGVGKTTLSRLVTESVRSQVLWVASTESSRSIPLGVFSHLVGGSPSRDATALLACARETFVAQGNSIVGVDDAHLLDELSATLYAELPYPESQLVALAHSLLARGVIDEATLQERLQSVRARLEA